MNFLNRKLGVPIEKQKLLISAYFIFLVTGMTSTVIGAIIPNLRESYGINYLVSGSLFSLHQIGNLTAVILAGILPFIIGRKKTASLLYVGLPLGIILITITGNPFLLLAAYCFTGIGRGNTSNFTNVIVADSTTNKTAGLNFLHAIFAFGAFTSPFILVFCSSVSQSHGWRMTLWFLALCMIVSLVLLLRSSLRDVPEQKVAVQQSQEAVVPFYKSGSYWLNCGILLFYLCGESANTGWLVTYFKDTGLMGQFFAQISSALLWIMIMCGRLTTAYISGKVKKHVLLLILAILNTSFFILMIATRSMPIIILGLLGTGLSMSGIYPTTLASMHPSYNSSPIATGCAIGIGLVGGIGMPIIVGAIADKVTSSALANGLSKIEAENIGITSGISAIAVALGIMLILTVIKCMIESRKKVS